MRSLFIFASSDRPDPYINTLAYAADHLQVTSVTIVVISEPEFGDESPLRSALLASEVMARILEQMEALTRGEYISYGNRKLQQLENPVGTDIYRRCLVAMSRSLTTVQMPLHLLDEELRRLVRRGDCIFDVTALKKNLLVDVVATLVSIRFTEVYSFELLKKPTFGPEDLYHTLRPGSEFLFRNLSSSQSMRLSLERIGRWSLRSRSAFALIAGLTVGLTSIMLLFPESPAYFWINLVAAISSIGSFLFYFIADNGSS